MKTPIISLLAAAGFLTLVSCTNLTSTQHPSTHNPQVSDHEKRQIPANSFAADLPLDPDSANTQVLMDAILERIGELPDDGLFGLRRAYSPVHEFPYDADLTTNSDGKTAAASLNQNYLLIARSWSAFKIIKDQRRSHKLALLKNPSLNNKDTKTLAAISKAVEFDTPAAIEDFLKSKADSLQIADKSNPKIVLELQKSYATSPKCYSCHEGIKVGDPIGVIGIKRIPLDTIK